jgi:cellulose synthase/poly-beta-1,6-N-acetylglucosamine synthase-like glycosyltransferase/peptidoglycan/xylan/chitin deacetylase (PgdA/CDA1 family)
MVFYDRSGWRKIFIVLGALGMLGMISVVATLGIMHTDKITSHERAQYERPEEQGARLAKTIVLTFDDGPEPEHTEELLAVLKEADVPATFFLLGENVVRYPALAKKIVDGGFEIGNHTFSHSRRVHESERRLNRELVTADRVISEATGYTTALYRPPFLLDIDLGDVDGAQVDAAPLRWAEDAGYVVVGANIDSRDWDVPDGASHEIVEKLLADVHEGSQVILLHDHGGSGATVEAVREFVPLMKERGYRFITIAEYFNVPATDFIRPAEVPAPLDSIVISGAKAYILGFSWIEITIIVVSVIALSRLWIILLLRKGYVPFVRPRRPRSGRRKPVSILIPAYNEVANIEATLRSVLADMDMRDEVIVVDDGSTDGTADVVEKMRAQFAGRLTLLSKENGGTKGAALSYALAAVSHGIIVTIDADTIIREGALSNLARHFNDPLVGAVAGKVYPANSEKVLAAFQYLEYMQGQNLDKEVFAALDATGIVPGAIGAWRMRAVRRAGGYSTDTVVEDQDLTLAMLAHGWRVIYDRDAVAYTETPGTIQSFFKQRSRWVFGTMQCAWKYSAYAFSFKHRALGWIVFPNLLLFNIALPLTIPLIDGAIIASLIGQARFSSALVPVIVYLLFDFWFTLEALTYEKKPLYRLVPLILWQRWFYRYMMALVTLRSVAHALLGSLMHWGAQHRRGECHPALNMLRAHPAPTPSPISVPAIMRSP